MTAPGRDEDDVLLEQLRAAVRQAGPPTPTMTAAGYAAYSWATVDAELAALTHDSLVDEPAGVRGASGPRDLVFEGERLSVELEHDQDCLVGQLVPPAPGEVILLRPDGALARSAADELGRFRFPGPVAGLVRLRCDTPSDVLLTDWIRL
ncbi:hypothetical protein OF117_10755 [Geodermatophilus sp. YIM 151500]|uniref:hypothetical protein n=1 Tax=Geodermatophilus sp. YIM 151500 TaxID=2984531 RepID=UPI0021E382F4|nr:hypothetical protein [Geodermatophilus sp. YIM 151500]MCV2489842.1 hypothetical protein [Geodermatophilus sp. YIM 151500]